MFDSADQQETEFLKSILPQIGYRWQGFRKPKNQVIKRIRNRIKELNLNDLVEYQRYLENSPEEWRTLDSLCNITITRFFRDRKLWNYLRESVFTELFSRSDGHKKRNFWSVGCCNGEEVYTLSIVLNEVSMLFNNNIEWLITATDRDSELINRARKGIFPRGVLKELTESEISKYFHHDNQAGGTFCIHSSIKQHIEFDLRDVRESFPDRTFDVICCRNLSFTYFSTAIQHNFLNSIYDKLNTCGYLIIGAQESLPHTEMFQKVHNAHPVYKKL